jgi:tetratricopeptide (TPR) repeat protein
VSSTGVLCAMPVPDFRYRAFISYSHQDDSWADWLHKALETYHIPSQLIGRQTSVGAIPRRLAPIFRDRDELASATDLSRKVNEALEQSANLIVICSPRSANSRWVNEEVLAFKRLGRSERIFCLIVAGEPNASSLPSREAEECFAEALRYRLGPDGALSGESTEPIAADARPGMDGRTNAKLKLAAGILDVGFDELRQRELHRRHRRMTAIAAAAAGITLITAALAIDAVIARRAAERRQRQAEDLVGYMLGDLNDKLARLQRLDIMEGVDNRAMRYFESLPEGDVTDQALAQRARALEKIGSVRLDQGQLATALESYHAALRLDARLADAAPANKLRQLAYANDWAWVGKTHWFQGDLEAASRDFGAAQRVLARAQALDPSDMQLRFEMTVVDNNIGHVLESQGRLDDALLQYRNMLRVARELVAARPDSKEWQTQLGLAHNDLGKLALMSGDLTSAIAEYHADDTIEAALSARDPQDNDQRDNVVTVRAILGRTLALTGDIHSGMVDLGQAVDLAQQLADFDPQNTTVQEQLALYKSQLSRLKRVAGELAAARALTAQSLAIFSSLSRSDPGNAAWQREFAEAQTEQAAQSLAAHEIDAACAQSQSALTVLEPMLAKQPDDRATLLATARARLQLAAVTADTSVAQQQRTAALDETRSVKSGRRDPRLLALQVEALLSLGRAADAQPPLEQLRISGYRDPALLAMLRSQGIDYLPQDTGQPLEASAK